MIAPLIISGPTGAGKTTLIRQLKPYGFRQVVSTTTRAKRIDEVDKVDYEFVSPQVFLEEAEQGEFIIQNEIFGNFYGTKYGAVQNIIDDGFVPVITIYTPYVINFLSVYPDSKTIFLRPKDIDFLTLRLATRRQTASELEYRVQKAIEELDLYLHLYSNLFEKEIVINSDNNRPVIEVILSLYKCHPLAFSS